MGNVEKSIDQLARKWCRAGIERGDVILIHSSIKRTLDKYRRQGVDLLPEHVLESFLRAVGQEGTLMLPLFNFDFPKTKFFDIRSTKSQMGILTECGRMHPKAVRTGNPIHSFAIIGMKSGAFKDINNESSFGKDSPLGILHSLNGKVASLDVNETGSMTFYHYVEEICRVPYRYFKNFSGTYVDIFGVQSQRTYKFYVRDLDRRVESHFEPAGDMMWDLGLYKGNRPGEGSGLRTIQTSVMFDFLFEMIQNGQAEGNIFRYGNGAG